MPLPTVLQSLTKGAAITKLSRPEHCQPHPKADTPALRDRKPPVKHITHANFAGACLCSSWQGTTCTGKGKKEAGNELLD